MIAPLAKASVAQIDGIPEFHRLQQRFPVRFPFLLESVADCGRYDLLLAEPGETLSLRLSPDQPPDAKTGDFFAALSAAVAGERCDPQPELPFCGGWFIFLGYESAAAIEPVLQLPGSPYALPDALAVRCRGALIRDHLSGTVWAVSERGARGIDELRAAACLQEERPLPCDAPPRLQHLEEPPPERFLRGVERIQEYLRAGDVFQVNLSRRWIAHCQGLLDPAALYQRLRRANPAPFAGLMHWQGLSVLSSSPERLISVDQGRVETRPIAGTHPRSAVELTDRAQRDDLVRSLKERAEHIMLLDLERNDLGRICRTGSVHVGDLMQVESYAHVHHIVSSVRGELRADVAVGDILKAVFPGGTITGCPKVRAMQIIAELEGSGRGPYTGSMGYLSRCGRMDLNILIRTLVIQPGRVALSAGAGIVADSDPWTELAETRAKAMGPLLALGIGG